MWVSHLNRFRLGLFNEKELYDSWPFYDFIDLILILPVNANRTIRSNRMTINGTNIKTVLARTSLLVSWSSD